MIFEIPDILIGFVAGIVVSVGSVIGLHLLTKNHIAARMEAWK